MTETVEVLTLELSTPTDHLGGCDFVLTYDGERIVSATIGGKDVSPELAEVILSATLIGPDYPRENP